MHREPRMVLHLAFCNHYSKHWMVPIALPVWDKCFYNIWKKLRNKAIILMLSTRSDFYQNYHSFFNRIFSIQVHLVCVSDRKNKKIVFLDNSSGTFWSSQKSWIWFYKYNYAEKVSRAYILCNTTYEL